MVVLLNLGQMTGMYINKLCIIFSAILVMACSQRPVQYKAGLDDLSTNYNLSLGAIEQSAYYSQRDLLDDSLKRDEQSLYLDLDSDGVMDYFDPDIDGDDVHNFVDSHPLDHTLGGEDINGNLIADFVESTHLLNIQLKLKAIGIDLIDFEHRADSSRLNDILFTKNLVTYLQTLKVINFSTLERDKRGLYNHEWKSISLFKMTENDYLETLIHETFHHFVDTNLNYPKTDLIHDFTRALNLDVMYNEFDEPFYELSLTNLPSHYAQTNIEEALAESLMYFWTKSKKVDAQRFSHLKKEDQFGEISFLRSVLQL